MMYGGDDGYVEIMNGYGYGCDGYGGYNGCG